METRPPAGFEKWVGLPFEAAARGPRAFDCWGLVRAVYEEKYGISLPSLDGRYHGIADQRALAGLVEEQRPEEWVPVPGGDERPGDAIVLRVAGLPTHLGLVVGQGWMLHTQASVGSVLEQYGRPRWRLRVEGFYRHRSLTT